MKILVTGSKGFIGKNLIVELKNRNYKDIYEYDIESTSTDLDHFSKDCDFVFHLAGVNRPKDPKEYLEGNFGFTSILLNNLKKWGNKCPIMLASSIQALVNNPYGISKKAGEELLFKYQLETGAKVYIYRFPNVFGKWCRPNYNSVIATFSYNIANNLPIIINDPNAVLNLVYIDDLVEELISILSGKAKKQGDFYSIHPVFTKKLGEVADLLYSFKLSRENLFIPNMEDLFTKKLYANYLSYLPKEKIIYDLKMNTDYRGSFTEMFKTFEYGQISINISKPGIVKGNHWHNSKNEKFIVISGSGVIRLRKIGENEIIEYYVNDQKLQVVEIPPGYTHNIKNIGNVDMVTVMWANECFDPEKPDTYYEEV